MIYQWKNKVQFRILQIFSQLHLRMTGSCRTSAGRCKDKLIGCRHLQNIQFQRVEKHFILKKLLKLFVNLPLFTVFWEIFNRTTKLKVFSSLSQARKKQPQRQIRKMTSMIRWEIYWGLHFYLVAVTHIKTQPTGSLCVLPAFRRRGAITYPGYSTWLFSSSWWETCC